MNLLTLENDPLTSRTISTNVAPNSSRQRRRRKGESADWTLEDPQSEHPVFCCKSFLFYSPRVFLVFKTIPLHPQRIRAFVFDIFWFYWGKIHFSVVLIWNILYMSVNISGERCWGVDVPRPPGLMKTRQHADCFRKYLHQVKTGADEIKYISRQRVFQWFQFKWKMFDSWEKTVYFNIN